MKTGDARRLRKILVFNVIVGTIAVSPLLVVAACSDVPNFMGGRTGPGPAVLFMMLATLTLPAGIVVAMVGSFWLAPRATSENSGAVPATRRWNAEQ